MIGFIQSFSADRKGLTLIEYALIAGLIAATLIPIMTSMGTTLSSFYSVINTSLATA